MKMTSVLVRKGEPMNDLISRQAAIGRAVEIPLFGKLVKVVAVSELEALPSAEPERKTGHKINQHTYPTKWVCSECGARHFDFSDNFCSQCGIDVREEREE